MTEADAREAFLRWRWPPDGEPECPWCGGTEVWAFKCRPLWKCRRCLRQFSATSGTIFRSKKMPFSAYLDLIAAMGKDRSMLATNRRLGHQYKTVYSVTGKLRKAMEMPRP